MMGANKVLETKDPCRDVWGQFNGLMMNAFLVNLNELEYKETMYSNSVNYVFFCFELEAEGKIKALITDSNMSINQKGMPQINITSYHHFIITTNKENPIKTEKDDRRKLIIRSSDELIKKRNDTDEIVTKKAEYFTELNKLMEDDNNVKTCYNFFKNYNLSDYKFQNIPKTEHQEDMKEMAESPVERWLCDFTRNNHHKKEIEMFGYETYSIFKVWCENNNENFNTTALKLGIILKNLKLNGIKKGRHTNKGDSRIFDIEELKKSFGIGCMIILDEMK
jgi:phage/plasmid-associated DNA primase